MSPSPPGHYQSRILNFVIRQTQKVIDQCDRAFRQVKVASLDATQVILYPVYFFLQTSRVTGHKLQQSLSKFLPQLSQGVKENPVDAEKVDQPIQEVLSTLTEIPATDGMIPNSPESRKIQGIASLIQERRLVLITCENQILDDLTPQQQERLSQRIMGEIKNYWSDRVFQKTQKIPLFQPLSQSEMLFPPLRFFWQLMAWVQTSPLALSTNLFGEASLLENEQTLIQEIQKLYESERAYSHSLLPPVLNDALTTLLTSPPPTVSKITATWQGWQRGILSRMESYSLSQAELSLSHDPENSDRGELRNLIQAAMVYFSSQGSFPEKPLVSLIPDDETSDPWLTETDLFFTPSPYQDQMDVQVGIIEPNFLPPFLEKPERVTSVITGVSPFESLIQKRETWGVNLGETMDSDGEPLRLSPTERGLVKSNDLTPANLNLSTPETGLTSGYVTPEEFNLLTPETGLTSGQVTSGESNLLTPETGLTGSGHVTPKEFNLSTPENGLTSGRVTSEESNLSTPENGLTGSGRVTSGESNLLTPETGLTRSGYVTPEEFNLSTPETGLTRSGYVTPKEFNLSTPETGLTSGRVTSGESNLSTPETGLTQTSVKENPPLEHQPHWLEAKVTGVGYIKHPLEIFLEWLDRGILWLEEKLVKFWEWWKEKRQQKNRLN